jgi:hypothetical protein
MRGFQEQRCGCAVVETMSGFQEQGRGCENYVFLGKWLLMLWKIRTLPGWVVSTCTHSNKFTDSLNRYINRDNTSHASIQGMEALLPRITVLTHTTKHRTDTHT